MGKGKTESFKVNFHFNNGLKAGMLFSLFSFSLLMPQGVYAETNKSDANILAVQQDDKITVTGTVIDEKGEPIIGANISQVGVPNGTITDFDGNFSIMVTKGAKLTFSYVGFSSQTLTAKPNMKVVLKEDSELLGEVVVTAMGIKRKEETLTYATQTVGGNELTRAKEANLINSLQGKSAGLTITPNSGGAGGASKILLRGNASMMGNNSPLIVIDGVPMQNSVSGQMNMSDGGYSLIDAGSSEGSDALSQLNPDDIESITVLKGANSAALYGSAASNGVLMITTKKGKEGSLRVDVSSSTTFETPLVLPELQNVFGASGYETNSMSSMSWGGRLSDITDYYLNPDNSNYHLTRNAYDISDFYQLGTNFNNSVSLSGGTKNVQTYFSYGNTTANGIVETNKFSRHNISLRQNFSFFEDRLKIDISANYINQKTKNRPSGGTFFNPIYNLYTAPRNVDLNWYRDNYADYTATWLSNPYQILADKVIVDATGKENLVKEYKTIQTVLSSPSYGKQVWFSDNINMNNPWWLLNRLTNEEIVNRVFGSFSANYKIIEGLNLMARLKYDYNEVNDEERQYATTWGNAEMIDRGRLILNHSKGYDFYGDFMLSFNRDIHDFNLSVNAGGSMLNSRSNYWKITPAASSASPNIEDPSCNQFVLSDIYLKTHDNYGGLETKNWERALFATAQLTWREMVTLEGSYRDDWYRAFTQFRDMKPHFAYWSVGGNAHLSKMMPLPEFMNDLKIRASYSIVGNSIPNSLFLASATRNPVTGALIPSGIVDFKDPKPETTGSFEAGFDLSMFDRALNIEATYYNAVMKNQFMKYQGAGGKEIYINGGKVRNQGVELTVGYVFAPNNNFDWRTNINYSFNINKILSVAKTQTGQDYDYEIDMGKNSGLKVKFEEGGSYGDLWAVDYRRNKDGEIIQDVNGRPLKKNGQSDLYLGNMNAKHTIGWANTFNYKDFQFYFLIDGKIGGKVISFTEAYLDYFGTSQRTADARLNAYENNIFWQNPLDDSWHPGMLVEGKVYPVEGYYTGTGGQVPLGQNYVYDATNFRLREISVAYTFRDLFGKSKNLTLSANARNLFFIYKKAPIDPETSLSTQNALGNVDVFSMPTTRSFGISIKATF